MAGENEQVGLTKDAGWQIGVSRTIPAGLDEMWDYLTGPEGLAAWLGPGARLSAGKGSTYRTRDGVRGEVRGRREMEKIRLSWQPPGRPEPAILQVAVVPNRSGCSVRFHQERLTGAAERERMRAHWQEVLARIAARWEA
jgi:uncharacterized protein YndB with AHSA1/START domain